MTTETYDKKPKLPAGLVLGGDETPPPLPKGLQLEKKSKVGGVSTPTPFVGTGKDGLVPLSVDADAVRSFVTGKPIEQVKQEKSEKMKPPTKITTAITQVKDTKPTEESIESEAQKKLQNISDEDLADPIKGINKLSQPNPTNTKDILATEKAKKILIDRMASDGFDAKEILNRSFFGGTGEDNQTARILRDRAANYDKNVAPLRELPIEEDLSQSNPEFLDYNYKDKIYSAAVQSYAEKNPNFRKELEASGFDAKDFVNIRNQIPNGKMGNIISEYLNDPDVRTYLQKENPNLIPAFVHIENTLLKDNRDFAINQVANKVSKAVQKSGFNSIDPIFNFYGEGHKEVTDLTAKEVLTPEELEVWNRDIKNNQEQYMDAPSLVQGIAEGGEGVFKGIANTFTEPFRTASESTRNRWQKEASHVSADPEGIFKVIRDTGHVLGLVGAIAGTGNVLGGSAGLGVYSSRVVPALSGGVLPFAGDMLEQGRSKYPDSPVKAWTSALFNTAMYTALSQHLFPAKNINQAISKVKPEMDNIVERLANGKITREFARQEANTVFKKAYDFTTGSLGKAAKITGELTGIKLFDRGLDSIFMDDDTYNKFHQPEKDADEALGLFLSNIALGSLSKYGEMKKRNNLAEESYYALASNPKKFERIIDNLSIDKSFGTINEFKENLSYIANVKKEMDALKINPKDQKRFIFESLKEKAAKEEAERATDPTIQQQAKEVAKHAKEVKEKILAGEDADKIVTESEQKEIDKQQETQLKIERLTKDNEFDNKKLDAQRKGLDGRNPDDKLKIEEIEEKRKRANEDYEREVSKLKPPTEEESLLKELKSKAGEFEKGENFQYFIDKAGEAPNQYIKKYGQDTTDKLLAKVPTEKLKQNLDDLLNIDAGNPNVKILDELIEKREAAIATEPLEKPKKEGAAGNVVPSTLEGSGVVDIGASLRNKGFSELKGGGLEKNGVRVVISKSAVLGVDQNGDVINVDSPNPKDIVLKEINIVDESARGKGNATEVLRDLLSAADENGNTIYIEPTPIAKYKGEKNLTEQQLINWYERHGFEKVNNQIWKRKPNAKIKETDANSDYENRLTYEEADKYRESIKKGEITSQQAKKSIEGMGFIVPKDILEQSLLSKEQPTPTQASIALGDVESTAKEGFTEGKDLNKMFTDLKNKYGDKKGSALYEVANRLVNPNKNTIVEIRSNGVVVKEGDKYILKPFGNTDANSKKWTLYKGLDITEQFQKSESLLSKEQTPPALRDVESTAKKIVGESAFDKLKKEGYTIEKGKFDSDAYASFFGLHTGVQASEFEKAGLRLVKPSEKIKVYRGKGKNVAEGENEGVTWVAEDKKVAENYSGDGQVEEVEVSKPKNPFPNPTDTIHVKGSDVGNKLKGILNRLFREGKVTKEQAIEASKAIDDFVLAAGEESELYSTKTNKKGVSSKYVKALQALGFDGIVQKESYNSGSPFTATKTGNETNTYGIFKSKSLLSKEQTTQEGKGTAEEAGIGEPPLPPPPKKGGAEMPEGDARKELDKLANNVPDSGRVAEYMSKETIEKYTGETPTNDQRRGVQELEIALEHGEKIIEKAQIVFGKDYVDKTLDYIEQSTAPVSNKALMYVSLENALGREKVLSPENAADITKQQALVYEQSQKFARENSLALNYQKLRKIAKVGYDIEKITDNFFSPEEREAKSKIEKAVEADADAINKEAENQEIGGMTPEIEKMVQEGVEKEIAKIYEKLPKDKKSIADKAIAALENVQKKLRGKAYDAVGGIPVAIVDAGISTIKLAIKAGVKVADAIELGINKIKEKWGKEWPKENEFRNDLTEAFKNVKSATDIVKEALIKKGFGRDITVKGEKKTILDWKKLAGKAGTVSKISENVAESLKDSGFSGKEIESMKDDLVKEYIDLRTSVIEKSQTELARRNKENVTSEQKSAARRLAELYTFGLFESKENEFDITLNKALGAKVSPEGYNEAKEIAKAMESIYTSTFKGVKLSDISGKAAIEKLEDRLRVLLFREARKQGNNNLRIATMVRNFMEIQQTMILNNMKQFFENPFSGLQQNVISKIEGELSKEGIGTGEMADQRRKMMKTVYRDMVLKGGVGYGKTEATFVNRQHLDDFINKLSDNQLYHAIASIATGKTTLNAMDAMWKVGLTEKKFAGNLIKILTHETNKNRMSKDEAQKFVSEKLTGQTLQEAQQTATKLIEKINKEAGKELIPTHKDQVNRLANDIVKASLEMGGKITSEQVDAAFNAAYRSAGLNLGHTANNFLSAMIHGQSAKIEGAINQAIRNKEWDRAALLTYYSVFYRNVLNPFVGGGTNWLVLKFEKTGLGLFTGLAYKWGTKTQLDLTTERGQRLMEDRLYNQSRIKDQYMRGLIGGLVTWTSYAAFLGLANTDDYRKWRGRNPWAARYLDIVTPESMLARMAVENKSVKRYVSQSLNKNDAFDASTKLIKAADYAVKGKKNEAWGALGEAVGGKINLPLPWRLVKDNQVIYQGIKGQDPYHGNYKPSTGFMNGVLQGGAIEWLGFRPEGKGETSSSASSKSQKPTKETKQSKSD